jgi:predicted metalloprotease with PDZ domain
MKHLSVLLVVFLLRIYATAQSVDYVFAAPNAVHHEAEISITATNLPTSPAIFRMSRSSPGRYATHEFGKNVYNVSAFDAVGKRLSLIKLEGDVYQVPAHNGTVKITYTLYANFADGTYSDIDVTNFHLNIPATFMWVKGLEKRPISIKVIPYVKTWTVATQLKTTKDPFVFTAPDLQYFMDSPIKAGLLHMREWNVISNNKPVVFRLALDAEATEQEIDVFTAKLKRVVAEATAVFGELPSFDYGTYTFIGSINPYVGKGDGMEHRNSTMITSKRTLNSRNKFPGVFAHEFFHSWNVERIRPRSLEPFNLEKANMSDLLWLAEGFTQYYGELILRRAGLNTLEGFHDRCADFIVANTIVPGSHYSAIENSQRAVFTDAGVSFDRTNYPNIFSSYYEQGAAIALALDLELRSRYKQSLDAVMQLLWKRFGKAGKPYQVKDVQEIVAAVSGDAAFADLFFKQHLYQSSPIDYERLLSIANYTLQTVQPGSAWIGNEDLQSSGSGVIVAGNTVQKSPLYTSGIDVKDILIELDGEAVIEPQQVYNIVSRHKPGDSIRTTYLHRGKKIVTTIVIQQDPAVAIYQKNKQATAQQVEFREQWMGSKVTE